LRVLHLGDECSILELFYLESYKVCQLVHHCHFELLHHYPAKLLTRILINRTKYFVIDIYLAYKQVTITYLSEKSRISVPDLESIRNKKISKAFIPCSWCLLKPIERLRELINMVGMRGARALPFSSKRQPEIDSGEGNLSPPSPRACSEW
jgi:hypothetical protein